MQPKLVQNCRFHRFSFTVLRFSVLPFCVLAVSVSTVLPFGRFCFSFQRFSFSFGMQYMFPAVSVSCTACHLLLALQYTCIAIHMSLVACNTIQRGMFSFNCTVSVSVFSFQFQPFCVFAFCVLRVLCFAVLLGQFQNGRFECRFSFAYINT